MRRRPSSWLATPLVGAASALGLAGLTGLLVWGGWLWGATGALAVTAAAVTVARQLLRGAVVPSVIGLAVAVTSLVVLYVPAADGGRRLPTPAALRDAATMLGDAVDYAQVTVAPAAVPPPLALAITGGLLLLFLIAEALAVGAGLAASSGFVLVLPWLPALAVQRDLNLVALGGALACWLSLLALRRRGETRAPHVSPREAALRGSGAAAAIALAVGGAVLAAPLVSGIPGWGTLPRIAAPASLQGPTRLSTDLDLRDSLSERSQVEAFSYSSLAGRLDVLRMYSVTDFDGATWTHDDVDATALPEASDLLWPVPAPGLSIADVTPVTVRATALSDPAAPLPAVPRTAPNGGDWRYDLARDEVLATAPSGVLGREYTVQTALGFHTSEGLRAAEEVIALGADTEVDPRHLALPDTIDTASIGTLARELTAGASTRYDQALALQEYLRGPDFTYSLDVSTSGADMVSTFLEQRVGYCQHFASTMAVMARTLGIPSRVAIGFLGGSPEAGSTGTFVVTRGDAHAWPELFFPGHGWVRFEPTPAQQTGNRPVYAVPESTPDPSPSTPEPSATASPRPSASGAERPDVEESIPGNVGEAASREFPWGLALAGALLLAAAAVAVMLGRRHTEVDPERAWARVRRAAGVDLGGSPALTPHEATTRILERAELGDQETAALERLRDAVTQARYAPAPEAPPASSLEDWLGVLTPALKVARRRMSSQERADTST